MYNLCNEMTDVAYLLGGQDTLCLVSDKSHVFLSGFGAKGTLKVSTRYHREYMLI